MLNTFLGPNTIDILENLNTPVYAYDKEWRISFLNKEAEILWGIRREDLLGKNVWSTFPQALCTQFDREYRRAVKDNVEVQFETFAPIQQKWLRVRAVPGNNGLIVYAQDISDRKQAESEALHQIIKLNQLIEICPIGILILDKSGNIITMNEAYRTRFLSNLSKEEYTGLSGKAIANLLGVSWETTASYKALQGEEIKNYIEAGTGWKTISNALPIKDNSGSIVGAMGIFYDITEYEQMKDELFRMDRLNLIGQMAAGVAHEIRNPMTVIRGYLQFFQRHQPDVFHEQLQLILNELDSVEQLISAFLCMARNSNAEKEYADLNCVIQDIQSLIQADAAEKWVEVCFVLSEKLPLLLLCKKEIKQLLINLVRNGIEAINGPGMIWVATESDETEVRLIIADTGPGISTELMNKIFDPFFSTKDNGTGLGLPICVSITQRHGGRIEIQPRETSGAKFIIHFPREI